MGGFDNRVKSRYLNLKEKLKLFLKVMRGRGPPPKYIMMRCLPFSRGYILLAALFIFPSKGEKRMTHATRDNQCNMQFWIDKDFRDRFCRTAKDLGFARWQTFLEAIIHSAVAGHIQVSPPIIKITPRPEE